MHFRLETPEGADVDERTYEPTLAFLNRDDQHVEVRIVRVVVNKESDVSASTSDEAVANQNEAESEFWTMRSFGLEAVRDFCDVVRLRGQPWIEPSGNVYPRVLNIPRMLDTESKLAFPFQIGASLDAIRFIDDSGTLSHEGWAAVESQLQSRELAIGVRLISEALYYAQSEQQSGPNQATLLAAMGVEVHTKATLRRLSEHHEHALLDLLLDNPHDWSLGAHSLFKKALPVVVGRQLGERHSKLAVRIQKLFEARNRVVHRGEQVDAPTAKVHAEAAKDALDYLNGLVADPIQVAPEQPPSP